jgi:hypothetical protein
MPIRPRSAFTLSPLWLGSQAQIGPVMLELSSRVHVWPPSVERYSPEPTPP